MGVRRGQGRENALPGFSNLAENLVKPNRGSVGTSLEPWSRLLPHTCKCAVGVWRFETRSVPTQFPLATPLESIRFCSRLAEGPSIKYVTLQRGRGSVRIDESSFDLTNWPTQPLRSSAYSLCYTPPVSFFITRTLRRGYEKHLQFVTGRGGKDHVTSNFPDFVNNFDFHQLKNKIKVLI